MKKFKTGFIPIMRVSGNMEYHEFTDPLDVEIHKQDYLEAGWILFSASTFARELVGTARIMQAPPKAKPVIVYPRVHGYSGFAQ